MEAAVSSVSPSAPILTWTPVDMLWLPCVTEILQLWICTTNPFIQQFIDGVDVGVGQLKALDLGLGGS